MARVYGKTYGDDSESASKPAKNVDGVWQIVWQLELLGNAMTPVVQISPLNVQPVQGGILIDLLENQSVGRYTSAMTGAESSQAICFQWSVFTVGLSLMVFSCVVIWRGSTAPKTFVLLVFPVALLLSAMFALRIKSVGLNKDGFTFDLEIKKAAAQQLIKSETSFAQQVAKTSGQSAVPQALKLVEEARSESDLKKIAPFDIRNNTIYFYGKGGFGEEEFGQIVYPVFIQSNSAHVEEPLQLKQK